MKVFIYRMRKKQKQVTFSATGNKNNALIYETPARFFIIGRGKNKAVFYYSILTPHFKRAGHLFAADVFDRNQIVIFAYCKFT